MRRMKMKMRRRRRRQIRLTQFHYVTPTKKKTAGEFKSVTQEVHRRIYCKNIQLGSFKVYWLCIWICWLYMSLLIIYLNVLIMYLNMLIIYEFIDYIFECIDYVFECHCADPWGSARLSTRSFSVLWRCSGSLLWLSSHFKKYPDTVTDFYRMESVT